MRFALVSSYVPRECGIATFSRDLSAPWRDNGHTVDVYAVETTDNNLRYPAEVVRQFSYDSPTDYQTVAEQIIARQTDVVSLQHEFGLYGVSDAQHVDIHGQHHHYPTGKNILGLMQTLNQADIPIITTLHTVLTQPGPARRAVLQQIAKLSSRVIVMTANSRQLLTTVYDIEPTKIDLIEHGGHPLDTTPADSRAKLKISPDDRIIMLSGLIGPNKGIESIIQALPSIKRAVPAVRFYIVGKTHPNIIRESGEVYRQSIESLIKQLDVEQNVVFVNHYLETDELLQYMNAADLYLTIHSDPQQAVSGTLSYALCLGKICVSTPYLHAVEALADGRGELVPFHDIDALVATLTELLQHDAQREIMTQRLKPFKQRLSWQNISKQYIITANNLCTPSPQVGHLPISLTSAA